MRLRPIALLSLLVAALACSSQATGGNSGAASSQSVDPAPVLEAIRANDTGMLAVSEEDGRFLRVLVSSGGTRRALEIGGASGYSGIWLGLGLRETGGRLTSIEYDEDRAREAADNIRRAGLDDVVTVIQGDAFEVIPSLEGTFDFVFLDAWKPDYKRFFDLVFPRLEPGGVFVAHNVVNKGDEMPDFLDAIQGTPSAWSTIVSPSGEGMSITYKKR